MPKENGTGTKSKIYGVWPKGRNTPIVVSAKNRSEAISKARKSGSAGAKGAITSAKQLNERDAKLARQGKWVRTRANGSNPTIASQKKSASQYKSSFREGPAKQSKR